MANDPASVICYIAASLDGFIADSAGSVDWLEPYQAFDEDYGYADFSRRLGTLIMGGNTYRQVLSFGDWPYQGIQTVVISHRPVDPHPGKAVEAYSGDLTRLIQEIKHRSDKDIWLVGGAQIIARFLQADLIDEWVLTIIPVMLGSGIPLFPRSAPRRQLHLLTARHYANGVVQLHYRFAR